MSSTIQLNILEAINRLETLLSSLKTCKNIKEKISVLNSTEQVTQALKRHPELFSLLNTLSQDDKFLILSLLVIEQTAALKTDLTNLLDVLRELEKSYDLIGGIIGYHLQVLKLIEHKNGSSPHFSKNLNYYHPPGVDLSQNNVELARVIRKGIESMDHMAEIYPVGGAGDRLNLHHEISGEALPAAELRFCGRTLLEGLIRDLQAREYLHYKLFGKQLTTPIAMMTSHEKNNNKHILSICEEHGWFGRPRESFYIFTQPLVPMVTLDGQWILNENSNLLLKPGGHGVIWKLLADTTILAQLLSRGFTHALVRQINNPMAGCDHGLVAFFGWGMEEKKKFGFASCPRHLNASEGMDLLIEKQSAEGFEYQITNIEYTEFEHKGIKDLPEVPESPYSRYPANTNILFVDLNSLASLVQKAPIPGMLINMKSHISSGDKQLSAGRLESTMQNIADYIVDLFPQKLINPSPRSFQTYITYNSRRKTISVTKKSYCPGKPLAETPEGCFFDLLQNHAELLTHHCHYQLPNIGTEEEFIAKGPSFILQYHPALGPFYSIIAQKIQKGVLAYGAELHLEIAELDLQNLHLDGSLIIQAEDLLGNLDEKAFIKYGEDSGKCILRNVKVKNRGINRRGKNVFWKGAIEREESLKIILKGNGEFFAENMLFEGGEEIVVPANHRMSVDWYQGERRYILEKLSGPSWYWRYTFDSEERIILTH